MGQESNHEGPVKGIDGLDIYYWVDDYGNRIQFNIQNIDKTNRKIFKITKRLFLPTLVKLDEEYYGEINSNIFKRWSLKLTIDNSEYFLFITKGINSNIKLNDLKNAFSSATEYVVKYNQIIVGSFQFAESIYPDDTSVILEIETEKDLIPCLILSLTTLSGRNFRNDGI